MVEADKPRCMELIRKGANKGKPCTRPAGYQTVHPGVGPCIHHGGGSSMWTGNAPVKVDEDGEGEVALAPHEKSIHKRIEELRSDPDLFDGRKELATLIALLERAVARVDEYGFGSSTMNAEARQLAVSVSNIRLKVMAALAARGYYMTLDQVLDILKRIGEIWHERMLIVVTRHPELKEALEEMERDVAARLAAELYLPDPASGSTPAS